MNLTPNASECDTAARHQALQFLQQVWRGCRIDIIAYLADIFNAGGQSPSLNQGIWKEMALCNNRPREKCLL